MGSKVVSRTYSVVFVFVSIFTSLLPLSAHASLSEYLGVGNAKAIGLGNAVTADPPGIDSIIFNPAGLVRQPKGMHLNIKGIVPSLGVEASIYHPDNSLIMEASPDNAPGLWSFMCQNNIRDPEFWSTQEEFDQACLDTIPNGSLTAGATGDNRSFYSNTRDLAAPNKVIHSETNGIGMMLPGVKLQNVKGDLAGLGFGASFSPEGANWTFATGVYADLLGLGRADNDPARYEGKLFSMVRLSYFTPSLAYRFSDKLSAGISMSLSWQGMGMEMDLRLPNFGLQVVNSFQDEGCEFEDAEGLIGGANPGSATATTIYQLMSLCGAEMSPFTPIGSMYLEAEKALSVGFTFGVLYEPTEWLTLGLNYRPEVKDTMKGQFALNYSQNWSQLFGDMRRQGIGNGVFEMIDLFCDDCMPYGDFEGTNIDLATNSESGDTEVTLPQPALLSLGASLNVTPRWKVNLDARWTDYDSWDVLPVTFGNQELDFLRIMQLLASIQFPGQDFITHSQLGIPFGFRSVWHFAIGTEFQYSDKTQFRFGYEPRKTAIPKNMMSLFAPFGDVDLYGVGMSYRMDKDTTIDLGLSYLISEEFIEANTSTMVNSVDWDHFILNPYPGSDIKTKVEGYFLEINFLTKY